MLHNTPTIPMESITGPSAGFLDETQHGFYTTRQICLLTDFLFPLNTSKLKA